MPSDIVSLKALAFGTSLVTNDLVFSIFQEKAVPKSKYEEDVFMNNHTTVWGSWWKDHQWGYKCCKQFTRNSYCTGQAGIDAAEASADLMRSNIERKEALQEAPVEKVEKNLATWGSEVADDLVLDKKKLKDALKKVSFERYWELIRGHARASSYRILQMFALDFTNLFYLWLCIGLCVTLSLPSRLHLFCWFEPIESVGKVV